MSNKNWAVKYVLDPLTAPAPSDETGPSSQNLSTAKKQPNQNPNRSKSLSSASHRSPLGAEKGSVYLTPPSSASPTTARFPHHVSTSQRQTTAASNLEGRSDAELKGQGSTAEATRGSSGRRRVSSLSSRFPGDKSHQPLEILRRENKRAQRSPHLRKERLPGPDTIDRLDNIMGRYHHEGPYDAALRSRNLSAKESPLEAVKSTNEEALKATPMAKIRDSLESHKPLDGVAVIPPGMRDLSGHMMEYEEGTDLMIEDGNYKRWPGVDYHPDDLKGKGEPSYSMEKALKQAKRQDHRRGFSDGGSAIEMTSKQRPTSAGYHATANSTGTDTRYADWQGDIRRSNTTGRSLGKGLKQKIGSLRRRE